jgi:hypothetical protein
MDMVINMILTKNISSIQVNGNKDKEMESDSSSKLKKRKMDISRSRLRKEFSAKTSSLKTLRLRTQ